MKVKLTLHRLGRPDAPADDLVITCSDDTTVGRIAQDLAARDPHGSHADGWTLRVAKTGEVIDPSTRVADATLRSGARVTVVREADRVTNPVAEVGEAGQLVVVAGPDVGRTFSLRHGINVIGRDRDCQVRLSDKLVSRHHVRINVGTTADLVDQGSANGTEVDGVHVQVARLEPSTVVTIGSTSFSVHLSGPGPETARGGHAFVRPPVLEVEFGGSEHELPRIPEKPKPGRIPIIALIAPAILGLAMYLISHRIETLMFVVLSPIMLVGNTVEARVFSKRTYERDVTEFRMRLAEFEGTMRSVLADERDQRLEEYRSPADLSVALRSRGPLLWSRRPEHRRFLAVRAGRATLPARTTCMPPMRTKGDEALWPEVAATLGRLGRIDGLPVSLNLQSLGSVGISGRSAAGLHVAHSIVLQVALLHSPAEVVVVGAFSRSTSSSWDWLKWLPHTGSDRSPLSGDHLVDTASGALSLVAELKQLVDHRLSQPTSSRTFLPVIVAVVEDDAPVERALLVDVLERGGGCGVHVVWRAGTSARLPAGCGAVVDVGDTLTSGRVLYRRDAVVVDDVDFEVFDDEVDDLARTLCPLVDVSMRGPDDTSLPGLVAGPVLLQLPESGLVEAIQDRWSLTDLKPGEADGPTSSLRAPVGVAVGEPFLLDLREHGPHALIGGTTGAGKSEFLQAWVMGLAMTYSPRRINFLFIDYKGGSAFKGCVALPHRVGFVTDLNTHLVDRALTSLNAELKRREELLHELDAKDIFELEARREPRTPPALVIVVDEFAALVQEIPEFVAGVVNVAQRGRSLGLHLVLATQRPSGVITGNLRANTNLRVALRMADEHDSTDVIETKAAAAIDASTPGRGFAKIGPGRLQHFQSAYYGGWTASGGEPPRIEIEPLRPSSGEPWRQVKVNSSRKRTDEPNDLDRLVAAAGKARLLSNIPAPREPWLAELPAELSLGGLELSHSDARIVVGTEDIPDRQEQRPFAFQPDVDGNMIVYGASGAGKSVLLRTLALAAGSSLDGPCHVYGIDFGSRSLAMLEELPHVGAVLHPEDHERITRLLRELRRVIERRKADFQARLVDSIVAYRSVTRTEEPRIVLMVDNYSAFRTAYDGPDRARWLQMFHSIAADGRQCGVHVVVSADRPGAVPASVSSTFPARVVMRLTNEADYLLVGVPKNMLNAESPPGRAVVGRREVQVAVLGGTPNVSEQAHLTSVLAATDEYPAARWPAPPVQSMPEVIHLQDVQGGAGGMPVIGIEEEGLQPVGIRPSGAFVVAGGPGSGKTTTVGTIAAAVWQHDPERHAVLFANRNSDLRSLLAWTACAEQRADKLELAKSIAADFTAKPAAWPRLILVVESVTALADDPELETAVLALLKLAVAGQAFVVVEGDFVAFTRQFKLEFLRVPQVGILLQPQAPTEGEMLFKRTLPRIEKDEFRPGQGFLVQGRATVKMQLAVPESMDTDE